MEITKPEDVNEALIAKSQTRTLDEIRSQGTEEVRVIRASDVASMISAKVDDLLRENTAMSDEDIEILVQRGPKEFKRVARERELDRQRSEEELQTAEQRVVELEQQLAHALGGEPGTEGGAPPNADLMMRMMTEMAEMKAEIAQQQQQPAAAPEGVAEALGQISEKLNSRLDQLGKKMGISSAVEAKDVDFSAIFDQDMDVDESNMDDVEVRKKTGGGIAANLARLKKLKGDG